MKNLQRMLDFHGPFAERMAVLRAQLRAVAPRLANGHDGETLSPIRWRNVAELILAVYAHAGADFSRYAQAPAERLCETSQLGRRAWYTARRDAVAMGLLMVESDRSRRSGVKLPDRLFLNSDRLAELVAASREQSRTRMRSALQKGNQGELRGTRWSLGGHYIEESFKPSNLLSNPPPAPHDRASGGVREESGDEVRRVAELLGGVGVRSAVETARAFVAAGGVASDAAAIVAVFQSGQKPSPPAWGLGALVLRLARWRPGVEPASDWPPPSEEHAEAARALERDRSERKARAAMQWRRLSEDRKEAILAAAGAPPELLRSNPGRAQDVAVRWAVARGG